MDKPLAHVLRHDIDPHPGAKPHKIYTSINRAVRSASDHLEDFTQRQAVQDFVHRILGRVSASRVVILGHFEPWAKLAAGLGQTVAPDFGEAGWVILLIVDGPSDLLLGATAYFHNVTITYVVMLYDEQRGGAQALQHLWGLRYHVQLLTSQFDLGSGMQPNQLITPENAWQLAGPSLLFATQGFDLAIPTIHTYSDPALASCRRDTLQSELVVRWTTSGFDVFCQEHARLLPFLTSQSTPADIRELWHSNPEVVLSEALCVRAACAGELEVSCITRVLRRQVLPSGPVGSPNLLLVMIDPMSRAQMLRSLPKSLEALRAMGFAEFTNYSVVGANSGPNQAAIYSGGVMQINRDLSSIRAPWLWDELNEAGYATMRTEDACIENSNMVKSLAPRTTHGKHLRQLFCFDWRRPNCLGGKLAARHTFEYASEFMNTYGGGEVNHPWAAFVHVVDSHEDSLTLGSILDTPLSELLWSMRSKQNTAVIVLADHGLHYGPYFQTEAGQREHRNPLLFMKLPDAYPQIPASNLQERVTAFDIHAALVKLLLGRGSSGLLQRLPPGRSCEELRIPEAFCKS